LHANVHALLTHSAVALATPVEHAVVHVPQWLTLLVVSTHVPLHRIMLPEQPETHVEFVHTGVPPLHAKEAPQPPQSLLLFVKLTHAPLQALYPLLHVNVHALLTHAAVALATPVVHVWLHLPQLLTLLVVSTQPLLQIVSLEDGHPVAHEYDEPEPTHAGVPPLHDVPQLPQLAVVVSWTQAPLQSVNPESHSKVQALLTHAAVALATLVVQGWPHVPQLLALLVVSTQPPLQFVGAAAGHPDTHE